MRAKLDVWYKNPTRLTHEELTESQIIEAFTMYLKSEGRTKDEDNPTVDIDEIIAR